MSDDDVTLFGKLKNKLIDSKQKWAESGRLLTGKTAAHTQRLPPGQRQVENWPVLDLGIQPEIPTHAWRLFVDGEVENPTTWKWGEFTDLPKTTLVTAMAVLSIIAAVREAYAYRKADKELIKQYRFMQRIFVSAHQALDRASGADEQREILLALGDAALTEHAEWTLMQRERQVEQGKL